MISFPINLKKNRRNEILILLLCFIIGLILRFHTFDKRSLWMDEIYTLNDSRDGFYEQIQFYKDNPTYLHPPFFFILTNFLSPFPKPERDLRILPLLFGVFSIPLIFFLSLLIFLPRCLIGLV